MTHTIVIARHPAQVVDMTFYPEMVGVEAAGNMTYVFSVPGANNLSNSSVGFHACTANR